MTKENGPLWSKTFAKSQIIALLREYNMYCNRGKQMFDKILKLKCYLFKT